MVALFETHHLNEPSKLRCVSGHTGSLFILLMYLGICPVYAISITSTDHT